MTAEGDFWRWRPRYHAIATRGWMNDPCGPIFNSSTGLYHLGFQWNPRGCAWGNMSWGSMLSEDLLHWDVSDKPSMEISGEGQDPEGVYSGCALATDPRAVVNGSLTAFYTSCNLLPLHYTLPYARGSERLHMATSADNGRTWRKYSGNPLLRGPPEDVSVYGWRDPFVSAWPALDRVLGKRQSATYAIISGSLRNTTPTVFLYELVPSDLTKWTYLSHLVALSPSKMSRWSGDSGINWEVANFFSLYNSSGEEGQFLIVGAEGVDPSGHRKALSKGRSGSSQLWLSGPLTLHSGQPRLEFAFGGILDHGCFYAGNSFFDPKSQQQIMFGWIMEGDAPESHYHRQGWAGMLSTPRVLSIITIKDVCRALTTPVNQLDNFRRETNEYGIFTLHTLAALPDPRLRELRGTRVSLSARSLSQDTVGLRIPTDFGTQWELDISFILGCGQDQIGFDIIHCSRTGQKTTVVFMPVDETITVNRRWSTSEAEINTAPEQAPHTLFYLQGSEGAEPHLETLDIRAFFDTSVLELFINDRTVLTTRVYPDPIQDSSSFATISPFSRPAGSQKSPSRLQRCDLWSLSLDKEKKTRLAMI